MTEQTATLTQDDHEQEEQVPSMSPDRAYVRMLVRTRDDFQSMRKRLYGRCAIKADGTPMNRAKMTANVFRCNDAAELMAAAEAAMAQELAVEKQLPAALQRFPIYTEWLSKVKGVGPIAAGWIIGELDIERATTVSKIWQFCGLNPSLVPGKKCRKLDDGTREYYPSGEMVRGDRLTEGHVSPFNRRLRTALVGVMADGFIKAQNHYCLTYYYPYKARLKQEFNPVEESVPGKGRVLVAWADAKKAHRDRAAKRYMIKMFLRDLYAAWRAIEGLPVREPYQVEYLGHRHAVSA
jgi:hypothetical protein